MIIILFQLVGYPGFDPPRPGQPEDILTDQNVKQGYTFVNNSLGNVSNDSFSAHGLIYGSLKPSRNRSALALLGDLMSAVYDVRAEASSSIPSNNYKLPPRVTLNDSRKAAWLAELSNPSVPLSKLTKSVLHLPKAPDLLDILFSNNVAISRAVWYVRILGANETLSAKSRPNYNPAQIGIEWAGMVTTHLKKQLQEIVLPSAPRPGLAIKSTFKSTLTQPDTKAKWVSKFAYCVDLLRAFYVEHMVDHGTVLGWLSAQALPANIAQFYFVLRLAEEYLDDMAQHRMFAQPVIEACLSKLVEIENSSVPDVLVGLASGATHVLQRLFLLNPDYFVCARVWTQPSYRRLLQSILHDRVKLALGEFRSDAEVADIMGTFAGVAARNDGLVFRVLPERAVVDMRATIADVQLLNSIDPGTDLSSVCYFQPDGSDDQKLSVLLTWAVTPSQYGSHRPFLACSLLARRSEGTRWQEGIWRWLDESEEARAVGTWENEREENVPSSAGIDDGSKVVWQSRDAVALLVGELIEKGLFSYGWYMQKLIARGITDPKLVKATSPHHRTLLHVLPLSSENMAMSVMRVNSLYGQVRHVESRAVKAVCNELQPFLLELVGGINEPWTSTTLSSLERYLSAGRYILMLAINDWLLATVYQCIDRGSRMSRDTFARIVQIFSARKCFSSMAELIFTVLRSHCDDILDVVIAVIERYMNIWVAMDIVSEIGEELFKKHQILRSEYKHCRSLFTLLESLSSTGSLPEGIHHQIESEVAFIAQSLHPQTAGTLPSSHSLPQIMSLLNETPSETIVAIADEVWYNHHALESWATVIWELVFTSLRTVAQTTPDHQKSEIASRYVTFLVKLSSHIHSGLDSYMREWLSTGTNDLLGAEHVYDLLELVLLRLVLAGVLSPSTILQGLVYPTWSLASGLSEPRPSVSRLAELANDLAERLIATDDVPSTPSLLPPTTLPEVFELSARRLPASNNAAFLAFINKFPSLVAMEIQPHLAEPIQASSRALRIMLVNQPQMATLSSRYMDVVRDSFLKPAGLVLNERLELLLVSVLKGIVNGGWTGLPGHKSSPVVDRVKHRPILTRIDPWGVTKASLDLHLTLKLLESSLEQDSSRAEAKERLADFSSSLFGRGMSSQSSDLVAGVLKGISGPVAAKFVNDGLERLTKALRSLKLNMPDSVLTFLNDSGETLRLLCRVILPLRDDPSKLPSLETNIKNDFLSALQTALEAILLTWKQTDHSVEPRRPEVVTLISRLNQFALGFPEFWSKGTNEKGEALVVIYLQMMKSIGNPSLGDMGLFPILLDTIGLILDEIPKTTKYPSTEALRQAIDPSRHLTLSNLPKEYSDRVLPLLKYTSTDPCTGLALRFTQQATRALLITHFPNRPWDWSENLDDAPPGDTVRNTGSIPLELFNAEMTHDRIAQPDNHGPNKLWNSAERDGWHMKTVIGSEVTFQREWVDSRILEAPRREGDSSDEDMPDHELDEDESPRGRQNSVAESTSYGKKRKASMSPVAEAMSDDDIQIIEGPDQNGQLNSTASSPSMQNDSESPRGLNILCIDINLDGDGGGVRGLSSLIILQEIMHRVESAKSKKLHPHEYFDIIAGTGTGGISACMLGRLKMPIENAVEEYAKLVKAVFTEKKRSGPTIYKRTKLEEALKTIIRDATGDEKERMNDQDDNTCKTIVFAMAKHNLNAGLPTLFRSYTSITNLSPHCTIREALYATMAQPELFKSIDIVISSVPQTFVGGELGCSNPLVHVLNEVKQIHPERPISCIISIGAGQARTIQVPSPSRLGWTRTQDVIVTKGMATDSERVAEEMILRFQGTSGVYFRFNVDQGMQNMKDGCWERLAEAMQHTNAYLQKNETHQKLEEAVRSSMERRSTITTTQAAGQICLGSETAKSLSKFKRCPAPTMFYTGRHDENAQVIKCITGGQEERRVCVVYGLGGVGKTQLVLNVIERTRDEWDYIIYVDASSAEMIERALREFGTTKSIGQDYKDAINWLESCRERWLLVFDNADNASIHLEQYIPARGQYGTVLVTTRLPDLARLARGPGSACNLSNMNQTNGIALLLKLVSSGPGYQCIPDDDESAARELVKDFGYLALAIVHAGAYIAHSPGMTISKYRSLFLSERQRMLDEYNNLPVVAKLDD
ncbi:unnamed protein product [Rhizoctonia solani]|uniref:PNPLA domain-containing protein n=1 Tax=Rhizoctonia solani TaxID=456999 RepID=A0A8H3HSC6_9AGAM|nr:unnamed protein product [Rhizoctonia solani]